MEASADAAASLPPPPPPAATPEARSSEEDSVRFSEMLRRGPDEDCKIGPRAAPPTTAAPTPSLAGSLLSWATARRPAKSGAEAPLTAASAESLRRRSRLPRQGRLTIHDLLRSEVLLQHDDGSAAPDDVDAVAAQFAAFVRERFAYELVEFYLRVERYRRCGGREAAAVAASIAATFVARGAPRRRRDVAAKLLAYVASRHVLADRPAPSPAAGDGLADAPPAPRDAWWVGPRALGDALRTRGALLKRSRPGGLRGGRPSWRRRWFVLDVRGGAIRYYADAGERRGRPPLRFSPARRRRSAPASPDERRRTLELRGLVDDAGATRAVVLRAPTSREADEWRRSLAYAARLASRRGAFGVSAESLGASDDEFEGARRLARPPGPRRPASLTVARSQPVVRMPWRPAALGEPPPPARRAPSSSTRRRVVREGDDAVDADAVDEAVASRDSLALGDNIATALAAAATTVAGSSAARGHLRSSRAGTLPA
ncbi:hypothetical protein JL722_1203 [Aureococcus anophagefferens]|nr:hypothetical protein JL722_1203 [Aureococcus anophagefferens]